MIFILQVLLCTAYFFASFVCADTEAPALLVLTPENFDDIIAEHSNVLVEVCVPPRGSGSLGEIAGVL